jgi:hypothetical protein
MSRRILCLLTVFVLALAPIGCNGDKSSSGPPRIKGGGDVDPKASGPVQVGGGKAAFKGND